MNTSNKDWTFGIVSSNINLNEKGELTNDNNYLLEVVNSIYELKIPTNLFEIIIIGENNNKKSFSFDNLKIIYFDETIKKGWITRKKNIIFEEAKYNNIIIVHDYIKFNKDWYNGFLKFDSDWDVAMVKILNKDNTRWRDWLMWPHCGRDYIHKYRIAHNGVLLAPNRLDYKDNRYTNTDMYISGSVIIGKKNFLIDNKLDESLCWGQGEDCEWSARCRKNWKYKMNSNSTLNLLKMGEDSRLF